MEKLYRVSKKKDLELIMTQIMNSLLQKSGLNWRKMVKALDHSNKT